MNRDDGQEALPESIEELLLRNLLEGIGGIPCLISTLERVTYGFSASEHAESLLVPSFGGGTVNPYRLVNTC